MISTTLIRSTGKNVLGRQYFYYCICVKRKCQVGVFMWHSDDINGYRDWIKPGKQVIRSAHVQDWSG